VGIVAASIHFECRIEDLLEQLKSFEEMRGYRAVQDGQLASPGELAVDEHFAAQFVKNIGQKKTRHFVIMPSQKGWLTLVEDGCHSTGDQDLAETLGGRLGCRVAYLVISEDARSILYSLHNGTADVESLWMVEGAITEHHGLPEKVASAADVAHALKVHLGELGLRRVSYRYEDFQRDDFEPAEMKVTDCWHLSLRRLAGITDTQQVQTVVGAEAEAAVRARAEEFYRKYTLSDAGGMYMMEVPVLAMVSGINTVDKYIEAVKERLPRADEVRIEAVSFEDPQMNQAKLKCSFLKDGKVVRTKYESWQKGSLYAFAPDLKKSDHDTWFHNIQAKGDYE